MSVKPILIVCLFALITGCATNKSVQIWKYEISDILVKQQNENGQTTYSANVEIIDYYINRISINAKEYPPRFSSKEEQEEVTSKLSQLINILEIIGENQQENPDFLFQAAIANSMGHNLDLQGSADRAKNYFDKLLNISPENPEANYQYGMFLSGTSAYHFDGIPYLEKALAYGQKDALFTLGLLAVQQGHKEKGLAYLTEFSENNPEDTYAKRVINAVNEGKIQFKSN